MGSPEVVGKDAAAARVGKASRPRRMCRGGSAGVKHLAANRHGACQATFARMRRTVFRFLIVIGIPSAFPRARSSTSDSLIFV